MALTDAEIEHARKEAERCKFQRGTQGVWARKWLALYAWHEDEMKRQEGVLMQGMADEIDGALGLRDG